MRGLSTSTNCASVRPPCPQKLRIIDETTRALTDLIDTERSIRLEATIVILIVVEILITFYDLFVRAGK